MRLLFAFTCLPLLLCGAAAAEPQPVRATQWVKAASSEIRLILPVEASRGEAFGGIEIRLPADAKTYWRTAGETGVPPTFDFKGSVGVGVPTVQFPAPGAFDDGAGGIAYGYRGRVLFPVRIVTEGKTGTVQASVDYGVCLKNMCVPAHADLSGVIGTGEDESGLAETLQQARAAVPVPVALAAAGPRALRSVTGRVEGAAAVVLVEAAGADAGSELFLEAEDAFTAKQIGGDAGTVRFEARASRAPSDAAKPWGKALITLRTASDAIETPVDLDAILKH